jgi:hypothetical protein
VRRAAPILMTGDEICTELGWSDEMVRRLLQIPDAPASLRGKHKVDRYSRDRVLADAQTTLGRAAKREWDETLPDPRPNPGWTTRLGDIGRLLVHLAVAVGKILGLIEYRSEGSVTDSAVRDGCGVRRWNGSALFYDWHLDRVLSAIRSTAEDPGTSAAGNTLAAAIAKQSTRDRIAARKGKQEQIEAADRQAEEAMISRLEVELRALRATDPSMDLLTAVEYITSDPAARIVRYKRCRVENRSIESSGTRHEEQYLPTIAWAADKDLTLLERRARSEDLEGYIPTHRRQNGSPRAGTNHLSPHVWLNTALKEAPTGSPQFANVPMVRLERQNRLRLMIKRHRRPPKPRAPLGQAAPCQATRDRPVTLRCGHDSNPGHRGHGH